ncbi:phosphatidate cytidylyltransferase [Actinoplanes sp. NPDC049596]|uniref:phosphatidate cytidylyltransferase n=1 Tax=unclassified Actinoplanes TaxID=2626549 RepID=UPI0034355E86
MSYLDPRAGRTSGDDTGVPAPYAYDVPGDKAWHAAEDVPTNQLPVVKPEEPKRGPGRRRAKGGGPGEPTTSRAGRNLPAAIGVGVGLVLVVLLSLLFWGPAFFAVIVVASGVGVWEMTRALRSSGANAPVVPLVAGAVLMTGLAWYGGTDALLLGLVVTVLAAVVWRLADGAEAFRRDLTASVLVAVYVPFLLSFGILLFLPESDEDGKWRVLCTLLAVVLSDTGGYATGVFFGKHKMAPSISPGKTWEGFAGSICASAIGSALLLYFLLDIQVYWGLLFGAVLSVVAVVGDLAESMLKRDLGVKDMSSLLPGHGGLMDRLDSILFAVPTAYLLFALIAWAQ